MKTTDTSARTAGRRRGTARVLAALGASLLVTGLVVLGAAGTATATDKAHPGAPGNNGTVKVGDETDLDEQRPENDPHLPCTFNIQWFNYDSGHGEITSQVTFELQAPTDASNGVTMQLVSGDTSPTFVGNGGQPGAGDGRDHLEWYTLAFTGPAHPEQGYHVKITVNTPFSKGNDVKHKVFWVGPCEAATTTPSNPVTSPSQPVTTASSPATSPSSPATSPSSPATSPSTPVTSGAAAPSQGGGGVVAGTETSKPKPGTTEAPAEDAPPQVLGTQAVAPTAVAAGEAGATADRFAATAWAALLIGAGVVLAAGAGFLGLRGSRGSHQA